MEIILREDVQHLGRAGEIVKVKDGYARNYLLPKGLAYPATEANKKRITYEAERLAKQRVVEKEAAVAEAQRLTGIELTFSVKVGEEDKLYGSVTAGDIPHPLAGQEGRGGKRPNRPPPPHRAPGGLHLGVTTPAGHP